MSEEESIKYKEAAYRAWWTIRKDRRERTLALSIAKERGVDFLIPLNIDGLRPTELDFLVGLAFF